MTTTHLASAVTVAREAEEHATSRHFDRPIQRVGIVTAIRLRRYGEAVQALIPGHAYEARVIVRSAMELHYNYEWMRLKPRSRAIRFLRFYTLETLSAAEDLNSGMPGQPLADTIAELRRQRTLLRYLFRASNLKGRRMWARHWATVSSFENRLREVQADSRSMSPTDKFMYGLYRWFSSTVHGGPQSFEDVIAVDDRGLREKDSAELATDSPAVAIATLLLGTWSSVAHDCRLDSAISARIRHAFEVMRDQLYALPATDGAA